VQKSTTKNPRTTVTGQVLLWGSRLSWDVQAHHSEVDKRARTACPRNEPIVRRERRETIEAYGVSDAGLRAPHGDVMPKTIVTRNDLLTGNSPKVFKVDMPVHKTEERPEQFGERRKSE